MGTDISNKCTASIFWQDFSVKYWHPPTAPYSAWPKRSKYEKTAGDSWQNRSNATI